MCGYGITAYALTTSVNTPRIPAEPPPGITARAPAAPKPHNPRISDGAQQLRTTGTHHFSDNLTVNHETPRHHLR